MLKLRGLTAASMLALAAASPAEALVFNFTISDGATGAGTFTTDDTPDALGGYLVTGISGALNGLSIAGLIARGGYAVNDNLLFPNSQYLVDGGGISFLTTNNVRHNIFYLGPTYALAGETDVNFTVTQATAGVPEPATWGMMLIGFALVGGSLRVRRRSLAFSPA